MKKYMQSLNEYYYEAFFSLDNDEEVEMRVDNDDLKKEIIDLMLEFSSSKEDYSKCYSCDRFFYSFEEEQYFAEVEVFYNDVEYLQNEDLSKKQVEKLKKILKKLGLELYPTQKVK